AMRLVAVQVQRDTEKHRLDGEERHEAVAPEGKLHETVRQETHGRVGTCSRIFPICVSDSISRCAPAASLSGKRAWITGFNPRVSNRGHTFSLRAAAMRPLLATGCARRVEALIVNRLTMRGRRSSSALLPPWVAMTATRPCTAAAATLRAT